MLPPHSLLGDAQVQHLSQVLYRCFEELSSTKAALYLDLQGDGSFHLITHYGWPRTSPPPESLSANDPLMRWVHRERRSFVVDPEIPAPELDAFGAGPEGQRFLVSPLYDRGEWLGLLVQRDRTRGARFDLARDEALTTGICEALVAEARQALSLLHEVAPEPVVTPQEAREPQVLLNTEELPPLEELIPVEDALSVAVPPSEAMRAPASAPEAEEGSPEVPISFLELLEGFEGPKGSTFQQVPVGREIPSRNLDEPPVQIPDRPLRPGVFMPEQRNFFWQMSELLFQAMPLSAVALWMDEPTEARPVLTYSRDPLSADLKQQILAHATYHLPNVDQQDLRILTRAAWMERPPLVGAFRTYLPLVLTVEDGGQDLLLLFRTDERPFTQREQELTQSIARLLGIHLQEGRLHERYHRAFLSVSHRILASLEGGAPKLEEHSLQTARLARNFALRAELPSAEVEAISIAAILHDVGTYLLDPELLTKPNLSPEDLAAIRTHPVLASTFLNDFQFPFDVLRIIRHHHERWDGSGYPEGLRGEEIPLGSRIINLVESFEVMSSGNAFKAPRPLTEILAEFRREAGRQFDPTLALGFAEYIQAKLAGKEA